MGGLKTSLDDKKEIARVEGYTLLEDKNFSVTKKVRLLHPEGYEWEVIWSSFLQGSRNKRESAEVLTHQFVDDYFSLFGYKLISPYVNAKSKVKVISPSGFLWEVPFHHFKSGVRCPKEAHGSSYGERLVRYILSECLPTDLLFKEQVNRRIEGNLHIFDFYIRGTLGTNIKMFIEYDGEQHFKPTSFNRHEGFEIIKAKDKLKNSYCDKNGIRMVRIPYWWSNEEVYNFLKHSLRGHFIDKPLDWGKLPDSPPMAEIVDYADKTSNKEAAVAYGISDVTVRNYRKRLGR